MVKKKLLLPTIAIALLAACSYGTANACKTCETHNPKTENTAAAAEEHGHEHTEHGHEHAHANAEEGFTTLFDGSSTDGWEFDKQWVRIEDGAIVMGSMDKAIPHHSYAVYTAKPFYNFELRLQAKAVGPEKTNGGVQFRSENRPEKNDMAGYQADMGFKYWGLIYDQSRRNKLLTKHAEGFDIDKDIKQGDWNDYVIRAEGAHIQVWINGKLTSDYTEADEKFIKATGVIGLQLHTGEASERFYRNIRIKELD